MQDLYVVKLNQFSDYSLCTDSAHIEWKLNDAVLILIYLENRLKNSF